MYPIAKRAFDVGVALALLVLGAPVLAAVYLAVWAFLGRPVIFRQARAGRDGELFTLLKFRSMLDAAGPDGRPLPDDQRLTRFGKLLRSTSLDELPSLVNVLRGEMSLVGPRPLLARYLPRYSPRQRRRHEVRPGITGWAQVNGRNTVGWDERFELDVWYVDNYSLLLDLKILVMTVFKVLYREGVQADGEATMTEFMGPGGA